MNNYHTHTYRCGHAFGREEDIIKAAIKMGITELGFSEHVPLPHIATFALDMFAHSKKTYRNLRSLGSMLVFKGWPMRMPYKEMTTHLAELKRLKQVYENQISIKIGFECEYFERYMSYFKKIKDQGLVDYLIFGNHYDRYQSGGLYYGSCTKTVKMIDRYREDSVNGLKSGLFACFAHPDLFLYSYEQWDNYTITATMEMCRVAKECNIPLELNAGWFRNRYKRDKYSKKDVNPIDEFWKIVAMNQNEVIIGIDAHDPSHFSLDDYEVMKKYANDKNLNLIDKLNI